MVTHRVNCLSHQQSRRQKGYQTWNQIASSRQSLKQQAISQHFRQSITQSLANFQLLLDRINTRRMQNSFTSYLHAAPNWLIWINKNRATTHLWPSSSWAQPAAIPSVNAVPSISPDTKRNGQFSLLSQTETLKRLCIHFVSGRVLSKDSSEHISQGL